MDMGVIPALAVFIYKLWKFSVQIRKAGSVLSRLSFIRFDAIRQTAPGTESTKGAVHVGFVGFPHISSHYDRQDPIEPPDTESNKKRHAFQKIERIEVHNNDKYDGHYHVKVDIYFTVVGMMDVPDEKEIQAMMEEMKNNPKTLKYAS